MRRVIPALPIVLWILSMASPALAQAAGDPGVDVSWSALDPGDDWAATIIRAVFPIYGPTGSENTGNAATVIGEIVRQLTGYVMAITCFFVVYTIIMQMVRGAETARIFGRDMSSLAPVRVGVAAIFMFPLASGFSSGQAAVVQVSMWGVGMAKAVYEHAVTAIGADARVIADPIIPGTRTIVAGLIRNEVCRALVNTVANNQNLVPAPDPSPPPPRSTAAPPRPGRIALPPATRPALPSVAPSPCESPKERNPSRASTSTRAPCNATSSPRSSPEPSGPPRSRSHSSSTPIGAPPTSSR